MSDTDRQRWVARLRRLREDRDFQQAETEIAAAAKDHDPTVDLELARLRLAEHEETDALELLTDIAERAPSYEAAVAWRIAVLDRQCQFEEATAAAEQALSRFRSGVDVRLTVGRLYLGRGRSHEALDLFLELQRDDNISADTFMGIVYSLQDLGRLDEAIKTAGEVPTRLAEDPEALARAGLVLVEAGPSLVNEGLDKIQRALSIQPDHALSLWYRCRALRALRQWKEAEAAARQAIAARPRVPDLHVELGAVFSDQGRYTSALDCVAEALRIDATCWAAKEQHVKLLHVLLRFDDAEDAARHYVASRPNAVPPRLLLAGSLDAQHHYSEALTEYEHALSIDRTDAVTITSMSATLRSMHCFAEAESLLLDAISRQPYNMDLLAELAFVYRDNGEEEAADRTFQKLHEQAVTPAESAKALYGRGWVAMTNCCYGKAIVYLQEALRLEPEDLQMQTGLAWANLQAGGRHELDQAEVLCRKILAEDPRSHVAHT